jgi:hypothetical protein
MAEMPVASLGKGSNKLVVDGGKRVARRTT